MLAPPLRKLCNQDRRCAHDADHPSSVLLPGAADAPDDLSPWHYVITEHSSLPLAAFASQHLKPASGVGDDRSRELFLTVARDIVAALLHMHRVHVAHCDISLNNVIVTHAASDPSGCTVKFMDFGAACFMDAAGRITR